MLTDKPTIVATNFKAYEHRTDPTMMDFNVLTYPSRNCTIPQFDKVVPDKGKLLLGQAFTENSGMIGNFSKFKTKGGIELEVRTWNSITNPNLRDVVEVLYNGNWVQITENTNPIPLGVHEVYFDQWYERNANPSLSKLLPRLIWVNGYENPANKKGIVMSWTGGIVEIINVTATTLTISSAPSWRSLGFSEDANGDAFIIVNGLSYQITTPADLDTQTVTVASTVGISVNDIATSRIETDEVPIAFDVCAVNKSYVYYGNWSSRSLYQSNAFDHSSTQYISSSQAFQNDLVISDTASFTGTGSHVFRITIDSVTPAVNEQTFQGTGTGSSNWDTSGYSASGSNEYKMVIIADLNVTCTGGVVPAYTQGEIIVGNTSGALLKVVDLSGAGAFYVHRLSGNPLLGETFTGQSSGVTSPTIVGLLYRNEAFFYKNGSQVTGLAGMLPSGGLQFALTGNQFAVPYDGIQFVVSQVGGDNVGDQYVLTLQSQLPDTFQWQIDGGTPVATGVSITGGNQTLQDGIVIQFTNTTGHALGDYWDIQVDQAITRAWVNFYYTVPIRKPGEGFLYSLPSNFWTMAVQEEEMYVNMSSGEWNYVQTQLGQDASTEVYRLQPLKKGLQSKVLYPYLIGHMDDYIVYVNENKKLDFIGRREFLELPQIGNLSQVVDVDFQASSFTGGRIKYVNKRLNITSPLDGIMLVYDGLNKYWQPPKQFPEMGLLGNVGSDLICHSNTRNQSFTMFASDSDNGDGYEVVIRTPMSSLGDRWQKKNSNMTFIEGYIEGNPLLYITVFLEPSGCGGIFPNPVQPIVCTAPDNAPLGQGSLGSHALGSDSNILSSYFHSINKRFSPALQYYFVSLQVSCISKNHTWQLLSVGLNGEFAQKNNNDLVEPSNLVQP